MFVLRLSESKSPLAGRLTTAVVRRVTLVALLLCAAGCSDNDRPTAPSALPAPPSTIQPPPTAGVPPLSGPSVSYDFSGELSYPTRSYTNTSKYVLYENGAFSLRYAAPIGEYVGTYRQDAGRIVFSFSADGRWGATGTLNGDWLEVRYNTIMEHSDFENAVYRRAQ